MGEGGVRPSTPVAALPHLTSSRAALCSASTCRAVHPRCAPLQGSLSLTEQQLERLEAARTRFLASIADVCAERRAIFERLQVTLGNPTDARALLGRSHCKGRACVQLGEPSPGVLRKGFPGSVPGSAHALSLPPTGCRS